MTRPDDIALFLEEGEGYTLEFKESVNSDFNLSDKMHFLKAYLEPALEQGIIERTLPNKPNSRLQKYRLAGKGKNIAHQVWEMQV